MNGEHREITERDEYLAGQYDVGVETELARIVALIEQRRTNWLTTHPATAMTLARADEDKQIIAAILGPMPDDRA